MSSESVKKLQETNIRKYGSLEAYMAELRRRASRGGKKGGGKGGFKDRNLASRAGRIGGINSAKKKRAAMDEEYPLDMTTHDDKIEDL